MRILIENYGYCAWKSATKLYIFNKEKKENLNRGEFDKGKSVSIIIVKIRKCICKRQKKTIYKRMCH